MATTATVEGVLERAGCPLHYWLSGPKDAPLVLFSHGATMDHRMFDGRVPAVAERHLSQDVVFFHPERVTALATIGSSCSTIEQPKLGRLALNLSPIMFKIWPEDNLHEQIARNIAVTPEHRPTLTRRHDS